MWIRSALIPRPNQKGGSSLVISPTFGYFPPCVPRGQHKHLIVRRRPSPLRCSQVFPQFSDTIGKYRTVYLASWWSFEDHKIFFEEIPRLSIDNSFFVNPQIVRSHTLYLDRHIFCGQNWVLVRNLQPQ
jgi:hypothetical protein